MGFADAGRAQRLRDETRGHAEIAEIEEQHEMAQVLIASRLSDGLVVFLSGVQGSGAADWVLDLDSAMLAEDDTRAQELLAVGEAESARRHTIIDPYLIDVVEQDGRLRPTKYRELIRCLGPTIRRDLGKQAESREA